MIPGDETGVVDVQILQNIAGNHYTMDVVIHKSFLKLPCIESDDGATRIGSW